MRNLGISLASRAELLGVEAGLRLAMEVGTSKLIIEVDTLCIRDALVNDLPSVHPDYFLLKKCKDLILSNAQEVKKSHIHRLVNMVAHALTNLAVTSTLELVYINLPLEAISSIVLFKISIRSVSLSNSYMMI